MLSPYFLQYVGRISVILLSWAALPWLVALVARAHAAGRLAISGLLRARGTRPPAG